MLVDFQRAIGLLADGKWGPKTYAGAAASLKGAKLRETVLALHLTEHFTIEEFLRSDTSMPDWKRRNHPTAEQLRKMRVLCLKVLEPLRAKFGPCTISSGFRIWTPKSQHGDGEAADLNFDGQSHRKICHWIVDNLTFDQLILEGHPDTGWIHVSYDADRLRGSVLRAPNAPSGPYYQGLGR